MHVDLRLFEAAFTLDRSSNSHGDVYRLPCHHLFDHYINGIYIYIYIYVLYFECPSSIYHILHNEVVSFYLGSDHLYHLVPPIR